MADDRPARILETLRKTFGTPRKPASGTDPFKTLIATIISQSTADRNTAEAFENLSKRFKMTPEVLANADTGQIEECLRVAGLYRNKARTIRQVSALVLTQLGGSLQSILSLPLEEARRALIQFPGVGPKTADVVLLFSAERPTIPVDTHVNRVSKRLNLAPAGGDYETVRRSLQSIYRPRHYLLVHLLLIQHGRKYCKAKTPHCKECPVLELCPSRQS